MSKFVDRDVQYPNRKKLRIQDITYDDNGEIYEIIVDEERTEGEVYEVLDVEQAQFAGHGLELHVLALEEAPQPLGQIVQLVHVDVLGCQPVKDGVLAVQPVHPAVLVGGGADAHVLQQTNGVVVLAVGDGEGNGGLPEFRVGLITDGRFENHGEHSSVVIF